MSRKDELYLISENTGERFRLNGCRRSSSINSTPRFGSSRLNCRSRNRFPPSVDLRRLMTSVESQGNLNSCVGNALAGAIEFLIKRDSGKDIDVSRLFLYYNSRLIDSTSKGNIEDIGVPIDCGIDALRKFGSCKENLHPYQESLVNERPSDICYQQGKSHRLETSESIDSDLNQMKSCLADGFPFLFGIDCFSSFYKSETNGGFVSMPKFHRNEPNHGGHALLAVGYLDHQQVFIVRNSYGNQWGDQGYIYIPYDYLTNDQICFSRFAIKTFLKSEKQDENETIEYNPTIDYSKVWPTTKTFDYYDETAFWYNDSYLIDLNTNSNWIEFENLSDEIYFGNRFEQTKFVETTKEERQNDLFRIIWIDRRTNENIHLANLIEKQFHVRIDFIEKYSDGEKFFFDKKENLRSTFRFLIICRGFYSDEKKNPLDLHNYLLSLKLGRIPIIIFTRDKTGLMKHFEKQSNEKNFSQWKNRFEIVDDQQDFLSKVKFFVEK